MFERFGPGARAVVATAEAEARQLGHDRIGTEHLLLGLIGTAGPVARLLQTAGATPDGCRSKVAELGRPVGSAAAIGLSERAQRVGQRADRLSLRRRDGQVEPAHLLASLLDVEGTAGQVLRGVSVDVAELRVAVIQLLERPGEADDADDAAAPGAAAGQEYEGDAAVEPAITGPAGPEPRCGVCGAPVHDGLPARRIESEDEHGRRYGVIMVYCRACGAVLGLGPDRRAP